MKLKTTLLSYGIISILAAIILGGIGYWAVTQLSRSLSQISSSSEVLSNSLRADMMHDAIRGDVLGIILATENSDRAALKEAQVDLDEHSKLFMVDVDAINKLTHSKELDEDIKIVTPKIEAYIAAAKHLSSLASAEQPSAAMQTGVKNDKSFIVQDANKTRLDSLYKELPLFKARFSELEIAMGRLDEHSLDFNNEILMLGNKTASYSKTAVLAGGVIVSIGLILLAMFITRRIMNTVGGEPAEVLDAANEIAHGNLANSILLNTGDTSSLLAAIKIMQTNLHRLVGEIKTSADSISTGAQEISAGNTNLSQRTEEQASSLEETASSMEQMASTVKQNAENAKQANVLAGNASDVAIKGGAVVGQVVTTMADINTSSKKIVDIISVIDGIAFQTNILALNAAVEAARAGEQGRGFAVVATEVRSLAQRSATAAKEIKQLIGDSVEKVAGGTVLVGDAGKTMEEIVASVKKVTDIVNEIAAASQEQSAGIDQVNNAITNMDEVTQQNAALVEEAAAAASSLESKAQELADITSKFILSAVKLPLSDNMKVDLNLVSPTRVDELTSKKMNGYGRLKAPKTKASDNSDWTAF